MVATLIWALALGAVQAAPAKEAFEPLCVADALLLTDQPKDVADAKAECTARYGWSDDEAAIGAEIGRTAVGLSGARMEAKAAGVDFAIVDTVFAGLSDAEREQIGWEGELDNLPIGLLDKLAGRLIQRGLTGEAQGKALVLVVLRARLGNAVDAFNDKRETAAR